MNLDKINGDVLKKMAVALNAATYTATVEGEETELPFITGKKIKTVAVTKAALAAAFDIAIRAIDDEVVNNLPDEIIDFYNECFSEAEEGEEGAEAAPVAEKVVAEKSAPVKEKKEKPVKEPKPKKEHRPKKEKASTEKSCFGHKLGTQAAMLDDLLAPGVAISLEDLVAKSGRSKLGVKGHIKHLIDSRGLLIENKDFVYRLIKQ